MNPIFTILSIAYVFCIFFWADLAVVSDLAAFNPYSVLHIPLYGILTILLTFSVLPLNLNRPNRTNEINQINQINQSNERNWIYRESRFLIPGLIGLGVAVADEIYQSFIPGREASFGDVFLDFVGITFALLLIIRFSTRQRAQNTR